MMEINGLFIAVMVIIIVFMILGYMRGILGIIFGIVSWVFFFVFVGWASPVIYTNLAGSDVSVKVSRQVYTFLEEKAEKTTEVIVDGNKDKTDTGAIKDSLFEHYGIMIPENLLSENGAYADAKKDIEKAAKQGIDETRGALLTEATVVVTSAVIRAASTLIAAIVAFIICMAVFILIRLIKELPLIGDANRTVGLLFGACEGILLVWIFMFVISVAATTEFGQSMMAQIHANMITSFLYDHNLILAIV